MMSTPQGQLPHSNAAKGEALSSFEDKFSATPIETYNPGSGLMFPTGSQPEPDLLERLWGIITFPYDHPLQTLLGFGFICGIALSLMMERHTGIGLIDRLHALFNPYCACHRCNPEFRLQRQEKASRAYRSR